MGKQQTEGQNKGEERVEAEAEPRKKIIKKMMFKKKEQAADNGDLKDWKPTKIQRKVQNDEGTKNQTKNIAQSFLGSLSKPVNKTENQVKKQSSMFDEDDNIRRPRLKPQINMNNLTEQQRKWDIQDQTFIRKQFVPKGPIQRQLQAEDDAEDAEEQVIKIIGKNGQTETSKVRHIDLNKIIDDDWQEELKRKNIKNQLWEGAEGVLDGRGNLAKLARQALQKANDIDSELNKRTQERKQMRSRYGW